MQFITNKQNKQKKTEVYIFQPEIENVCVCVCVYVYVCVCIMYSQSPAEVKNTSKKVCSRKASKSFQEYSGHLLKLAADWD